MRLKMYLVLISVFALGTNDAFGQGDFFWSTSPLNSGAVNSDPFIGAATGVATGSLYLYYTTVNSELDTGAGLDLSWTNDGVVAFTAARTFDFEIALASMPDGIKLGERWEDAFGPASEVTANTVTGLNAFTVVGGDGIINANNGSGAFLDQGYDAGADAFLFGRVDYEILDPNGQTELITAAGAIGIVHDGQTVNPIFGGATFGSIPEPTSVGIFVLGIVGLLGRRVRR